MFTNTLYRNLCASVTSVALALSVLAAFPLQSAHAQSACSFTRDLYVGVSAGEDVRCLQKFLNASGFTIATSGVGSPGNETTIFGVLTRQAAIRWQTAQGLSPATGTWGPGSRGKYNALKGGTVTPATPASPSAVSTDETRARVALSEAISAYEDAVSEVGNDDDAEDFMSDATDSLVAAFRAFLNRSYTQAITLANNAKGSAEDAIDEVGGSDDDDEDEDEDSDEDIGENDAQDAIEDADQAIEDAEEAIDDSNADDEDIEEAEDLVDEAQDLVEEAQDAFDDEDWEDAFDAADEAIELAEEAIDIVGGDADADEEGAANAISDAEDAFDDAVEDVNDAEDDGDDVDDAQDLLDDAEELIDDANAEFDDEDWGDAIELAEEAMDTINDALDTL